MEFIKYLLRSTGILPPDVPRSRNLIRCPPPVIGIPPLERRCCIDEYGITIRGYPSRGGIIVLERAGIVDFEFLNISRLDPPGWRALDPKTEDKFCQRLLLLGAKWFDSMSRYNLLTRLTVPFNLSAIEDVTSGRCEALTWAEKRWVCVGWPSTSTPGKGPLWVGEWESYTPFPEDREGDLLPEDLGRLNMAVNMDERCKVLDLLGATYYDSIDEYEGHTYLKTWATKFEGDVEELQQTWKRRNV